VADSDVEPGPKLDYLDYVTVDCAFYAQNPGCNPMCPAKGAWR
jgi:hypothetical protein